MLHFHLVKIQYKTNFQKDPYSFFFSSFSFFTVVITPMPLPTCLQSPPLPLPPAYAHCLHLCYHNYYPIAITTSVHIIAALEVPSVTVIIANMSATTANPTTIDVDYPVSSATSAAPIANVAITTTTSISTAVSPSLQSSPPPLPLCAPIPCPYTTQGKCGKNMIMSLSFFFGKHFNVTNTTKLY